MASTIYQLTRQLSQRKFLRGACILLAAILLSISAPVEVFGCVSLVPAPKLHVLDSEPCCYHISGLDYCPDGNRLIRGTPYCGRRPCFIESCRCYERCQPLGWYFALYKDTNFSGKQLAIVNDQKTGCVNLNKEYRNWAKSVNTNDKCVRIYNGLNCQGESTDLAPNQMGTCSNHKNLKGVWLE